MLLYILFFVLVIAISTGLYFISRTVRRKIFKDAIDLKLLSVTLPNKKNQKDLSNQNGPASNWKDEINHSAQLYSILAGLNSPFVLEAAVPHVGEEIQFYIGVPRNNLDSVSRQIEGLFKNAQIEQIDDYNVFNSSGTNTGAYLGQKLNYAIPLRTYVESNVDTFDPILSGLSKINEIGEGAAIQIIAKPAPDSVKKNIGHLITQLKKGVKREDIFGGMNINLKDLNNAFSGKDATKKDEKIIIDEDAIKALESKVSKTLLVVNFRVFVSAPSLFQANNVLDGILNGISQFSAPLRQELKIIKPKNIKKFLYEASFREFNNDQVMSLSSEELASLFHFPISTTDIPRIKWLRSKEASPPNQLAAAGTLIGESNFRGDKKNIYITDEDRRRHIYIIGQTGTGKTNLINFMAADDIKKGKGIAIIDPHGELVESIMSLVPKERLEDVIIFDPGDLASPLGMNILEYDFTKPEQKTFIVNELFNILDKLYDMKTVGGPMFEQYTKNAILLLMEDMMNEPSTLMEIPRIFNDDAYRQRKLARIRNPIVVDFWTKEAVKTTGEHSLANMTTWITSKFNNFLANDYMRPIIGQTESSINFRKIMDEKKILLINLSKGKIGDINMGLLGMIILGKMLMAALSRVDTPEDLRNDFNVYIDEFQNFATDSIPTTLSEARKYRMNLTLAHQFITQIPEKIRDAIFGNVGSKIVFRVGSPDAEFLAKEFESVFSQNDLTNIANYNAYVKILIKGYISKPFNIKTIYAGKGDITNIEKIKEISRKKYGKERQVVEDEIYRRYRS